MRLAAAVAALAIAAAQSGVTATTATDVCVIDDPRATELSGLVSLGSGYVAANDSQFESAKMRIFYLDASCKVTRSVGYPTSSRDPEDLAMAPDGSIWVGDIGDNLTAETHRQTVALWQVPESGDPVIHRLTYPDGPHDAEALLFDGAGVPVIVTKEPSGVSALYQPTASLQPRTTAGVPMKRVGEFRPVSSGENNNMGVIGELLVTGAAVSPDRSRVALRTLTAAYEWDVPDGDVVKAITTQTPRLTGLPDEPQGEALAYTSDGTAFLTVSDELGPTTLRRHVRSEAPLQTPPPATPEAAASAPTGLAAFPAWVGITAGAVGLLLAVAGYLGLRRGRRNLPRAEHV